jgi:hypothetical protein
MNDFPGVPCAGLRKNRGIFSCYIPHVLSDKLSPGICRHPTGRFCVIMPMRVTIPAGANAQTEASSQHHAQAAA